MAGRGRWDVDKAGLPGGEIELRVFGNGQYYGRFMMRPKPGSRPSLQARLVAVTLAEQSGRALAAGASTSSAGEESGRAVSGVGRGIVGAGGSPGSLQALRYGERLARVHGAVLIPVLAWDLPGGDYGERVQPSGELRQVWRNLACRRLTDALVAVWGETPNDPLLQPHVERG